MTCGPLNELNVIMQEAFTYAVEYANTNILSKANLSLGLYGLDSCDTPTIGFQKGITFIKGYNDGGLCVPPENGASVPFDMREDAYERVSNQMAWRDCSV